VLLSTAARRIKAEKLTKEQVEAIKLIVKYLRSLIISFRRNSATRSGRNSLLASRTKATETNAVSFKDVVFCTRMLRDAGIEPMLQLGKSVDEYLSLLEERSEDEQN
jgi:hypothetical protein